MNMSINILVAEDNSDYLETIRMMLRSLGFQNVTYTPNGKEALITLLAEKNFDLLITDWQMPIIDGLELVLEIRDIPEFEKLPIIMLSSEDRGEYIKKAHEAGISTYLDKQNLLQGIKPAIEEFFP